MRRRQVRKKIVDWIRSSLKTAGGKGIVLGLSGGIDSSVAAALAKQAAGRDRVLALILPCHSQPQDIKDAYSLAKTLKIKTKTIDLTGLYDSFIKVLPKAKRLASANLKPRLRMTVLYYFANKLNYLVCGTGNKSELKAGYFSKHGDGATDILPLGDLLKGQVRELAKELDIPKRIIEKVPSAGLWPGQTDEGEMGITYDELDDILARMKDGRHQVVSKQKVNKVKQMIKGSEHKRQAPKICRI